MARRADSSKKLVKKLELAVAVLAIAVVVLLAYVALTLPTVELSLQPTPPGQRLSGIDAPLTPAQLSVINNASNNYFEDAGEMLLNLSIPGEKYANGSYTAPLFEADVSHPIQSNTPLIINGKPSVIYIGAISCIYCGENRWAMALALSRFGSFNSLYTGFSSLGDGDLPTLYWIPQNYTATLPRFGNDYSSNYINFFSAEYDSPIKGGFSFPASTDPIQYFVTNATNPDYLEAMQYMNKSQLFEGTPFTAWGGSFNLGADGVVLGNSTSFSSTTNYLPLSYMTHQQVYNQLQGFNTTFAYEEYAVSDIYIAETCSTLNNTAPICALPAIGTLESKMGLS